MMTQTLSILPSLSIEFNLIKKKYIDIVVSKDCKIYKHAVLLIVSFLTFKFFNEVMMYSEIPSNTTNLLFGIPSTVAADLLNSEKISGEALGCLRNAVMSALKQPNSIFLEYLVTKEIVTVEKKLLQQELIKEKNFRKKYLEKNKKLINAYIDFEVKSNSISNKESHKYVHDVLNSLKAQNVKDLNKLCWEEFKEKISENSMVTSNNTPTPVPLEMIEPNNNDTPSIANESGEKHLEINEQATAELPLEEIPHKKDERPSEIDQSEIDNPVTNKETRFSGNLPNNPELASLEFISEEVNKFQTIDPNNPEEITDNKENKENKTLTENLTNNSNFFFNVPKPNVSQSSINCKMQVCMGGEKNFAHFVFDTPEEAQETANWLFKQKLIEKRSPNVNKAAAVYYVRVYKDEYDQVAKEYTLQPWQELKVKSLPFVGKSSDTIAPEQVFLGYNTANFNICTPNAKVYFEDKQKAKDFVNKLRDKHLISVKHSQEGAQIEKHKHYPEEAGFFRIHESVYSKIALQLDLPEWKDLKLYDEKKSVFQFK